MPQLDATTFSSQLFWLVICFLALYFILSYILVPKIAGVLENRETIREKKINQASLYREEAESLLMTYEQRLSEARQEAQHHYQFVTHETILDIGEKKKEMLDKLQERLHIAEQSLHRARIKANADMHTVAQEIAGKLLQKVTGQTYSADQLVLQRDQE